MGYLDSAGLSHFWAKVKSALAGKQDALTPDGTIRLRDGAIGVALPAKAVSKAEYDALAEAEKQAEAVYLVDEPAWEMVPLAIQEYDTADGWHVRKWSSGYVEMWITQEYTAPEDMVIWMGWRLLVAAVPENELPVPLTARLNENAFVIAPPSDLNSIDRGFYGLLQTGKADLTHTCAYSFLATEDYSSRIITISIAVAGRWK